MFKIKKIFAFSMVELSLMLLISGLLIAATTPLVTKRHLRLPNAVKHGTYMCFYKVDNTTGKLRLYEKQMLGNVNPVISKEGFVDQCTFTPPKKARYFQISAIGGGGGGSDAGYNGGGPAEVVSPNKFSPWNFTGETLTNFGLKDLDYKNYTVAQCYTNPTLCYPDFMNNAGQVWAFAKSVGSGKGGNIGYMDEGCWDEPIHWYTSNECETYTTVTSDPGSYMDCDKKEGVEASGDCGYYTVTETSKTPIFKAPTIKTWSCCTKWKQEWVPAWTETKKSYYDCNCREVNICPGGGQGLDPEAGGGNNNCKMRLCDKCEKVDQVDHPGYYKNTDECAHWGTCEEVIQSNEIIGYDVKKNTTTHYVGSSTYCDYSSCTKGSGSSSVQVCSEYKRVPDQWRPECGYTHKTVSGGAAGSGVTCSTREVPGNVLLEYKVLNSLNSSMAGTNANPSTTDPNAVNGPFGLSKTANSGYSPCASGEALSCGSYSNTKFGEVHIYKKNPSGTTANSYKTKAYSAWKAGTGASRSTKSCDTSRSKFSTCDAPGSAGTAGQSGRCAPASEGYEDYPNSNSNSASAMTGYFLRHRTGVAELSGQYTYKRVNEENYLTKGNPGKAGEFVTVIVRSLEKVDTTIHIGRGGAGANLDSGGNGVAGSGTFMGSSPNNALVYAKGGAGGTGSEMTLKSTMPIFDKDRYNLEKSCFNNSSGASCSGLSYKYFKSVGGEVGLLPQKISMGGMFNFVLTAFQNDSVLNKLLQIAGRGGRGGGLQHMCWASKDIVTFEGVEATKSSVYPYGSGKKHKVECNPKTDYKSIAAEAGSDGALIIRW